MNKTSIKIYFVLTVSILCFAGPLASGATLCAQDLVKNGGFETGEADSLPSSWRTDEWSAGSTRFGLVPGAGSDGSAAFMIESDDEDDAKLIQRVAVEPKTLYRASVRVKASGIPMLGGTNPAKGANISVLGVMAASESAYDTAGGWVDLVLYGRTGPKQKSLELALRLGGYSSLNRGKAFFDQVSLRKVKEAPTGSTVHEFFARPSPAVPSGKGGGALPLILFSAVLLVLWMALRGGDARPALAARPRDLAAADGVALGLLALAGLLLRLVYARGGWEHSGDLGTFMAWGDRAFDSKIVFFYRDIMAQKSFADYPPLYMAVLAILSGVRRLFGIAWQSAAGHVLVRLPALAADFALAWILYRFAARRAGRGRAFLASAILLLSPAMIWNSAAWGQVDSVFSLFILGSLLYLGGRRWVASGVLYGLACLMKPQAFIFAPIWLGITATDVLAPAWSPGAPDRGSSVAQRLKPPLSCLAAILATLLAGWLPFMISTGPSFPFKLYASTLASYPYATLNAANLWGLLGMNFTSLSKALNANGLSLGALGLPIVALVSLAFFGLFFWLCVLAVRSRKAWKMSMPDDPSVSSPDRLRIILGGASFLIFAVFIFSQKMHERYLLPFIPLALAWAVLDGRKAAVLLVALVGALHFLNVEQVLSLSRLKQSHVAANDPFFIILSALGIAAFLGFCAFLATRPRGESQVTDIENGASGAPKEKEDDRHASSDTAKVNRMMKADSWPALAERPERKTVLTGGIVVACATLLSLFTGLWRLGDLAVPERGWKASHDAAIADLDMGEQRDVAAVSWYSGIGDGKYALSLSTDGKEWKEAGTFDHSLYCWRSLKLPTAGRARYLRVEASATGGTILELAAWDAEGRIQPLLPLTTTAAALVDEQSLAKREAGYMDSMYFDEIYHARTALEYKEGLVAYEWTHPPLGKLIIGVGIEIFGMGPFGWRIMGAIAGALLVPLIWLLALLFFPRGWIAVGAALLYAADGMRIVQSRIGTVDTFTVAFLFLAFIFMGAWYLSARSEPGKRALWALPLAGLAFGLAAATKWNALYVAPALAIIFFSAFIPALVSELSKTFTQEAKGKRQREAASSARRKIIIQALITLVICALAFIIIPLAVYVISYAPTLKAPGKDWQSVWDLQKQMYGYHANLKAEHAFASPWWAWSFMLRPLWYFKGEGLPPGLASTIVAMGNPLTWWPSLIAFLLASALAAARRDLRFLPVPLAYFFLYLPWVGISRLAFIYHYFPIFPFGLFSILYCVNALLPQRLGELFPQQGSLWLRLKTGMGLSTGSWVLLYALAAIGMAAFFWPALTGFPVAESWIRALKWMPTWIF